ncbi:pilin N-terminal domain-containing protein [Ligilactobacillus salivarius]|uniref:pilin N-terminal domain-containing protein n=1 Tax=Ligilactobacillus salivarius TaxID=1624 RepID=UPI0025A36A37|nr:pilin N-terminal domain-containing protein [Ligilactobacillus salivarius]MDM8284586.1 pilin N-terminal domain-containing protein [Ligilactobacillus salivarius]
MTYSKMVAGLMLSTTLLGTGATVLADTSSSSSSQSTTSAKATSSSSVANSSSAVAKTNAESTSTKKESKNDPVQTLKEQKMIIKKIVAKEGSQIATVSEANNSESKVDTSSASTAASTSNSSSNSSSSSSESKTDTPKGGTSTSSSNESTKPTTSSSSQAPGLNQSDFKGVPNSKFVVYDVTDTMNSVIKEKLGVDEDKANAALQVAAAKETAEDKEKTKASDTESKASSNAKSTSTSTSGSSSSSTKETTSNSLSKDASSSSSSETKDDKELISKIEELRKGDTIRKEVSERAAKLNKDQLKSVAEVTTDQNGTAETKLPIDGKYHAYYVVNTETAKESYATNSAPIVVITPVTDSQGMYAPEFTIYPKSNTLPKPTTPEETQAKMYQTGHEDQSFFTKIMNWFNGLFK